MTDGLDQGQAMDNSVPENPVSGEMVQPEMSQEKMLRQSEVNDLAGRIRSEAFEKGRQQAMSEFERQREMSQATTEQVAQGAMSPEEVRQIVQDQAVKFQREQAERMMAEKVVGEFVHKMENGPSKYEDFEDVVKDINLIDNPDILQLANSVPNTEDVMYELAKHPNKFVNLKNLLRDAPALAIKEIRNLSTSIADNSRAKEKLSGIKEPLSQIKPSAGTVDSGSMSINDFRSQSWLRG